MGRHKSENISILLFKTLFPNITKLPNKVNNKCPATIFAANRIDKVNGRIILLTVSIIILPNHNGKAIVSVNLMCLVLVKIYGNKPIKLEKIIKKKNSNINKNIPR